MHCSCHTRLTCRRYTSQPKRLTTEPPWRMHISSPRNAQATLATRINMCFGPFSMRLPRKGPAAQCISRHGPAEAGIVCLSAGSQAGRCRAEVRCHTDSKNFGQGGPGAPPQSGFPPSVQPSSAYLGRDAPISAGRPLRPRCGGAGEHGKSSLKRDKARTACFEPHAFRSSLPGLALLTAA